LSLHTTLTQQLTTVKLLGGKGAGWAGRIAPQTLINAAPDVLASPSIVTTSTR
jgi:hypothetical protein